MGFYSEYILPTLLNSTMKQPDILRLRNRLVPKAEGDVLEIGIGSGLNLPFYAADLKSITGIEPSRGLRRMADRAATEAERPVVLVDAGAEDMPFDHHSFDTVISTWTMCSIPELEASLDEMRRVLKPGGKLLFVEHGKAPEAAVQRWQNRINPLWKAIGGGCHLNRPIADFLEQNGFVFEDLEQDYLVRGPKWSTYTYLGAARAR